MRKLIVLAAALAVAGCTSAKSASSGGPTNPPATTNAPATNANTPATAAPPPANQGGDWCALAAKIGHDSRMLVGTHYVKPQDETLDQLKALVNESLANRDALLTGVPADVHAALLVEGEYFQALHDHDFSTSTPTPAGLTQALAVVNKYQTDHCGFVFDN